MRTVSSGLGRDDGAKIRGMPSSMVVGACDEDDGSEHADRRSVCVDAAKVEARSCAGGAKPAMGARQLVMAVVRAVLIGSRHARYKVSNCGSGWERAASVRSMGWLGLKMESEREWSVSSGK